MESSNRNATRKRKLSQSKEQTDHKSVGCFGQCCSRKKSDAPTGEQAKLLHRPVEKIAIENEDARPQVQAATGAGDKNLTSLKTPLSRSPLYNESASCGKPLESECDPCLACTVQCTPDTWENVPMNRLQSNGQIDGNHESMFVTPVDAFSQEKISSFVNDIIGDGVDRMSGTLVTIANKPNQQIKPTIDEILSVNSSVHTQEVNRKEKLSQQQLSGLVFKKPDLKTISQTGHQSSVEPLLDGQASSSFQDNYNWNIGLNSAKGKAPTKENSSQNQESYNWDYQDYSWSSAHDLLGTSPVTHDVSNDSSHQTAIIGKNIFPADDETTDPSYSIVSPPTSNKKQKTQSCTSDLKKSSLSLNHSFQHKPVPPEELIEDLERIVDQPRNSVSNLLQQKPFSSTINATLARDQEMPDQNDRFSSTSVSDLFKQVTGEKQQKPRDLASISTAYSIPVSVRPSVLPEVGVEQNHTQSSRTSSNENDHSTTNTSKRLKSNHILSPSMYHDMVQSWRYFLQRLVGVMLPSTFTTSDHSVNLPPSIVATNSHSWSTLTRAETRNIGPWWGRRDADDHAPATFIFANEPFSTWYSLDATPIIGQACRSIENEPCCSRDDYCSSACRCCCRSSSS